MEEETTRELRETSEGEHLRHQGLKWDRRGQEIVFGGGREVVGGHLLSLERL